MAVTSISYSKTVMPNCSYGLFCRWPDLGNPARQSIIEPAFRNGAFKRSLDCDADHSSGSYPELTVLAGAGIVIAFYLIVAPRVFCGWVCPMNIVTDAAAWLRRKMGLKASYRWSPQIRYWLIGVLLVGSGVTGTVLWAWLDPVATLHRGLVFGMGAGWILIALVFIVDLLLVEHGWCGHLCPLGAMYGVIGRKSVIRVKAVRREDCDKCMDCFYVCPEPEILRQPLKEGDRRVMSQNCISCGRCVDVCAEKVFEFKNRLDDQ